MNVNTVQAKEKLYELLGLLENGEEDQIVITRKVPQKVREITERQ